MRRRCLGPRACHLNYPFQNTIVSACLQDTSRPVLHIAGSRPECKQRNDLRIVSLPARRPLEKLRNPVSLAPIAVPEKVAALCRRFSALQMKVVETELDPLIHPFPSDSKESEARSKRPEQTWRTKDFSWVTPGRCMKKSTLWPRFPRNTTSFRGRPKVPLLATLTNGERWPRLPTTDFV